MLTFVIKLLDDNVDFSKHLPVSEKLAIKIAYIVVCKNESQRKKVIDLQIKTPMKVLVDSDCRYILNYINTPYFTIISNRDILLDYSFYVKAIDLCETKDYDIVCAGSRIYKDDCGMIIDLIYKNRSDLTLKILLEHIESGKILMNSIVFQKELFEVGTNILTQLKHLQYAKIGYYKTILLIHLVNTLSLASVRNKNKRFALFQV